MRTPPEMPACLSGHETKPFPYKSARGLPVPPPRHVQRMPSSHPPAQHSGGAAAAHTVECGAVRGGACARAAQLLHTLWSTPQREVGPAHSPGAHASTCSPPCTAMGWHVRMGPCTTSMLRDPHVAFMPCNPHVAFMPCDPHAAFTSWNVTRVGAGCPAQPPPHL